MGEETEFSGDSYYEQKGASARAWHEEWDSFERSLKSEARFFSRPAAELLARVFDRFESHTAGSRHRGVGLGLSIVRAFMELHGGKVFIDSAPGEGTTVTCIFPAPAAHEAASLAAARAGGAE